MKIFEKITKCYALENNYFKRRLLIWPDTLSEIFDYWEQHGELPFRYEGNNWPYAAMCERQKHRGVHLSQYLTPDATAHRMALLAMRHFGTGPIMDVCCGTGQLTRALLAQGAACSRICGLDADREMTNIYSRLYPLILTICGSYRDIMYRCENVIANPPFESRECTDFLAWLAAVQASGDHAVLLLPRGFIDKSRPRELAAVVALFAVLDRTPMQEAFARTNACAEIVVLERL